MKITLFSFIIFFSTVLKGQNKSEALKLDWFDTIPSGPSGCSGLYTYDSVSLKREKYIIVTDLAQVAFIKINGNQVRLKLVGDYLLTDYGALTKKTYKTVFRGETYKVILDTKKAKGADKTWEESETWRDQGTVEIVKGKKRIKLKVHGVSGC
jgi:hypothetical protein